MLCDDVDNDNDSIAEYPYSFTPLCIYILNLPAGSN